MNAADLPPDLGRLERVLAGRRPAAPSPEHRARVLAAVQRELAGRTAHGAPPAFGWKAAAALAAGMLLALNLAMSAANHARRPTGDGLNGPAIERAAAEICALAPDLGPREARRQALVLRGAAALAAAPAIPGAAWFEYSKEVPAWATR